MNVLSSLLSIADFFAGALITGLCVISWWAMDRRTKHCFRFVYLLLGIAGLALAVHPFYGRDGAWAHSALAIGVALYLVLDRRRIRPQGDAYVRIAPSSGQRGSVFVEELLALLAACLIVSAILATRDARADEAASPTAAPTAKELKMLDWMRENCTEGCAILPARRVAELVEAERRLREENERLRGKGERSKASCL